MNQKIENLMKPRQESYRGVQPVKFLVWLIIIASIMLFGAVTSAIVVRSADGAWAKFAVPNQFYISTVIVLLSSLMIQLAYVNAKKDNLFYTKLFVGLSIILGVAFIGTNYSGWMELSNAGFALSNDMVGGQSASFFHFATYLHAAHVLLGLLFLLVTFIRIYQYKVHGKNLLMINISTTYWHFVDILWIYLFLFLILSR
jgi:cytochrome c oxidase subunit 3